jgi:hypothetical protein
MPTIVAYSVGAMDLRWVMALSIFELILTSVEYDLGFLMLIEHEHTVQTVQTIDRTLRPDSTVYMGSVEAL